MPNYPDPVTALIGWLADLLAASYDGDHRRIVPEQPTDLTSAPQRLPTHVIERIGGYDPHPGVDIVRVNVDTYATGGDPYEARSAALARAEDVRRAIRIELPGADMGGIWVSKTTVVAAPTIRFWDTGAAIRRAQATYELTVHTPL